MVWGKANKVVKQTLLPVASEKKKKKKNVPFHSVRHHCHFESHGSGLRKEPIKYPYVFH